VPVSTSGLVHLVAYDQAVNIGVVMTKVGSSPEDNMGDILASIRRMMASEPPKAQVQPNPPPPGVAVYSPANLAPVSDTLLDELVDEHPLASAERSELPKFNAVSAMTPPSPAAGDAVFAAPFDAVPAVVASINPASLDASSTSIQDSVALAQTPGRLPLSPPPSSINTQVQLADPSQTSAVFHAGLPSDVGNLATMSDRLRSLDLGQLRPTRNDHTAPIIPISTLTAAVVDLTASVDLTQRKTSSTDAANVTNSEPSAAFRQSAPPDNLAVPFTASEIGAVPLVSELSLLAVTTVLAPTPQAEPELEPGLEPEPFLVSGLIPNAIDVAVETPAAPALVEAPAVAAYDLTLDMASLTSSDSPIEPRLPVTVAAPVLLVDESRPVTETVANPSIVPTEVVSQAPVAPNDEVVAQLLRPMLQQWLDDNMPRIIEKALRTGLDTNSIQDGSKSK
jgi:cell pole-organizing protein PopZ